MTPFTIQGGAVAAAGAGAAVAGNTGNGTITAAPATGTGAKAGIYRAVCVTAAANGGVFNVFDPDGVNIGQASVAVAFTSHLTFTIADGATDFIVGDAFTITVHAQLAPSSIIPAAATHSVTLPVPNGARSARIQAKVTNGATLRVQRLRPDKASVSTVGEPGDVTLATTVEGYIDVPLLGDAALKLSLIAAGSDVTVDFVDVYFSDAEIKPAILSAAINATADGDNTVIAAVAGKKIRVISYVLTVTGAANPLLFEDDSNALLGKFVLAANGGASFAGGLEAPAFTTDIGKAVVLNNPAGVDVFGHISYVLL